MRKDDPKYLARIENVFVEKAHYQLPPNHQKILLYAIANVDPTKGEFKEIYLSVKDMEQLLSVNGKPRRDYKYINSIFKKIGNILISFDSDLEHNGVKLQGHFSLIQSSTPIKINGQHYMEILFSKKAKPFLLRLNEYVKINLLEVAHMKSGHAIRLFQAFKAIRNKQHIYNKVSIISYDLEELKKLLGISGKYSEFKRFNERVLKRAISDINKNTSISIVEVERIKGNDRKIKELVFHIIDQENPHADSISKITSDKAPFLEMQTEAQKKTASKQLSPTPQQIGLLPKSKWHAYEFLVSKLIFRNVAIGIIEGVKGELAKGWEDVFIALAWEIFIKKSEYRNINENDNQSLAQRAGAFVIWFKDGNFNSGHPSGAWSKIMEHLQTVKLNKSEQEIVNREKAQDIPRAQFEKLYRASKPIPDNDDMEQQKTSINEAFKNIVNKQKIE